MDGGTQAGGGVIRAVVVEGGRLLRDRLFLACLILAVLPAASLFGSLPEARMDPTAIEALRASFRTTLAVNVALLAAAFGAVRTSTAFACGLVARDELVLRAGAPFWTRAAASSLGGACIGVVALCVAGAVGAGLQVDLGWWPLAAPALVVGLWSGIWGFAVGAVVRAPLSVLLVVVLTLSPALPLAEIAPELARALPLGSVLVAVGAPFAGSAGGGQAMMPVVLLLWAVTAMAISFLVYRLRPRLR